MKASKVIDVICTHTEGEISRHIVGGIPPIPGNTMAEKMIWAEKNMDWLRKLVNHEPRGGDVSAATIILPPCDPRAQFGVLHPQVGGWEAMCGHNTIGVATMLVETGMVEAKEPVTDIVLDTAAGLVTAHAHVENGHVKCVSFRNAPAFVYKHDLVIHTKEWGDVTLDISFGGLFYAIVSAETLGLRVCMEQHKQLIDAGVKIREYVNQQIEVIHPVNTFIRGVHHVELYSSPLHPEADVKNTVVCPLPNGGGFVDRSPCGTGTSAKSALLASLGKLPVGASFVHESITGTLFTCTNSGETTVAGIPAIYPEVKGRAFVITIGKYLLDPDDPFQEGFLL